MSKTFAVALWVLAAFAVAALFIAFATDFLQDVQNYFITRFKRLEDY